MKLNMKYLIALMFSLQLNVFAQEIPAQQESRKVDHLSTWNRFGGAPYFCNIFAKLVGEPQNNTSCTAIMLAHYSPELMADIEAGKFGQIFNVQIVGKTLVYIVTTVTVEQLEVLRYDPRIKNIAPDAPMGTTTSFTVKN